MFDSRLALGVTPYGCLRGNGDESGCFDLDEVSNPPRTFWKKSQVCLVQKTKLDIKMMADTD
jgi:hypothetical protein